MNLQVRGTLQGILTGKPFKGTLLQRKLFKDTLQVSTLGFLREV